MKLLRCPLLSGTIVLFFAGAVVPAHPSAAAEPAGGIKSVTTHREAYGATKGAVAVDPAKDLPRLPPVEPQNALGTWQVKEGFKLEIAAHEPLVRSPIAVSFDERGRMFVCEMIDYSERRDETPHLGRISMLEDKDGDGRYESSKVFAENLAWPTGLIWANGGLYVIATPDIIRFEDTDRDGRAEKREVVYTGFGTGLKILNVQGMANCPQWGMDSRVHLQAGGGNRGKVKCLKRPDLPELELGGRDFWFDPLTHEFGLEAGGGQYGMSYDTYGRKFVCSNSDHLQFFVCDDAYARRNPYFNFPQVRQSIAVDGGAAEVFRLSPDEPWRIIRTRWRIAGVVKGAVEGGGRVSGYFTGATGTTVYRGDAYGPEFVNNTFTGDAGGQLIHRKVLRQKGASLEGERPADERGREFAASKDTWCRIVNFANAPDGCLYAMDMYRETIEHPWAIPDEIKQHLDLNSGNDRGRIYRITPAAGLPTGQHQRANFSDMDLAGLVKTLEHANGWHRETAARLIYERQDKAVTPLLVKLLVETKIPLAKFHALWLLEAFHAVGEAQVLAAIQDKDEHVRELGIRLSEGLPVEVRVGKALRQQLAACAEDPAPRVRMQLAFTVGSYFQPEMLAGQGREASRRLLTTAARLLAEEQDDWTYSALVSGPPALARELFENVRAFAPSVIPESRIAELVQVIAARQDPEDLKWLMESLSKGAGSSTQRLRALDKGLRQRGSSLAKQDAAGVFKPVFDLAAKEAAHAGGESSRRHEAVTLLEMAPFAQARPALAALLQKDQPGELQQSAVQSLVRFNEPAVVEVLLEAWPALQPAARAAALEGLLSRPDRILALYENMGGAQPVLKPEELSSAQVQALIKHTNPKVATMTKQVLAAVIPKPRETVIAEFQPASSLKGDAARGQLVFMQRCFTCHRAGGQGFQVGPDLITVKTKGREALLSAILDPNKEVAPQFIAYTVETQDGQTLGGLLSKDDTSGVTVRMTAGAEVNIARAQVKKMSAGGLSLMPEGLEAGMDAQGMADLLEFVETLK